MPGVVDYSPAVLDFFVNSPLRSPTEWFVRHTFFGQFVAGETVEGCMPTLKALRERNVGAMLNYSAEVHDSQLNDDSPAKEERDRKEREKKFETIIAALEAAGEYERSLPVDQRGVTGFALKIVRSLANSKKYELNKFCRLVLLTPTFSKELLTPFSDYVLLPSLTLTPTPTLPFSFLTPVPPKPSTSRSLPVLPSSS